MHRFFSSLIQRAAKLHKRLGGGSLTLLPILSGVPAKGEAPRLRSVSTAVYKHVSEAQRQKLRAALELAQKEERLSVPDEGSIRTEVRPYTLSQSKFSQRGRIFYRQTASRKLL